MDDAMLVRIFQRLSDVDENRHDIQITGATQFAQIAAGRELHRQSREVAFTIGRLHFENQRVIEAARNGVLAQDARPSGVTLRV